MSFQEDSMRQMLQVIGKWSSENRYTNELKQVLASKNTAIQGELLLTFTAIAYFKCKEEIIPVPFSLTAFQTNTLSANPISDNVSADAERLKKELPQFTERFYELVESRIAECEGDRDLHALFIE